MKQRYKKKSNEIIEIANRRIAHLFDEADLVFSEDKRLADRYVEIARKIGMKYKVRLKDYKKRFCKHCHSFLKVGENCRVRLKEGKVVYYCMECKKIMRWPYLKEKRK